MSDFAQLSRTRRATVYLGAAALAGLAASAWTARATAADGVVPLDTPSGITIQQEKAGRKAKVRVYADANGMTLYTSSADQKGKSSCDRDCTKLWIPARAIAKAPSADWSIVRRGDGTKQWALFGQPLYTYAKDSKIGEAAGATAENRGWQPAVYQMAKVDLPPQISVREVPDLFGQVLVNWENRTLYLFQGGDPQKDYSACKSGKEDCGLHWTPVTAPALAEQLGDFTVLHRRDGTAQWAYKGRGLYTYDRDVVPDLAEGRNAEPLFRPAMVRRTFMPTEIALRDVPGIAPILTTAQGMTLYRRVAGTLLSGAFYLLGGVTYKPSYGYDLGLRGCDNGCEKVWSPLRASSNAQSTGYWYVVKRPDGSKLWAYKGFVLYTFSKDKAPGDYTGDGRYDMWVSEDPKVQAKLPGDSIADDDGDGDGQPTGVLSWMRAQTW